MLVKLLLPLSHPLDFLSPSLGIILSILVFVFTQERIKQNGQEQIQQDEVADKDPRNIENCHQEFWVASSH
jgi:hypothetical protein